jgi:hypothetical protein
MNEIKLFAKHYHKLGLNITCISNQVNEYDFYSKNIIKAPNHKWDHLFELRQIESEIESYNWGLSTSVGNVT